MLNKKGLDTGDWFQVVFSIFFIAVIVIIVLNVKTNITNKIDQYAEESLEKVEGSRHLLEFLSSVDTSGRRVIDLLSTGIAKNDYREFDSYAEQFFKAHYKDTSEITWALRIYPQNHHVEGPNFNNAALQKTLFSVKISMPNGETIKISLHVGKDIGTMNQYQGL